MIIDPIELRNRILYRLNQANHNNNQITSDTWLAVSKALVDEGIGTGGAKWYEGAGTPNNTIGDDGDFYLNVANGDVYVKVVVGAVLMR